VAQYFSTDRTPTTAHWRTAVPIVELPVGRDLAIEDTQPFKLHLGHDGWRGITDRDSTPTRFGLHSVTLTSAETSGRTTVAFTRATQPAGRGATIIT
jgi:glucoamylase